MTKYYVDASGNSLGNFEGTTRQVPEVGLVQFDPTIPAGAIEVPVAPSHGLQHWNGTTSAWEDTPAMVQEAAKQFLAETDGDMPRMVEDMWAALKAQLPQLKDTDLPADTQAMLNARAAERAKL